MKKFFLILLITTILFPLRGQYISEVLEYTPAPGQFTNDPTWGNPETSPQSLIGGMNGSVSLGAFGGYVVFRFDEPVANDPANPFGIDFTIFGNPLQTWSEPGVVYVMRDENGNGLPDDTWYELAGSDYFFSTTVHGYEATYYNPNSSTAADVLWTDNQGNVGYVYANGSHTQPYYPLHDGFPHIDAGQYTLGGTLLEDRVDRRMPANIKNQARAFGYADNKPRGSEPYTLPDNPYTLEKEHSGGDAFDISWAVDENGQYVDLEEIHFVKVQCGMLADAGWLGEISTEITGAVDVAPNPDLTGITDIIVIKPLPDTLTQSPFAMEVFAFRNGRYVPDTEIAWHCTSSNVAISSDNVLSFNEIETVTLTASLADNPEITTSVSVCLMPEMAINELNTNSLSIYPNPTNGMISISVPEAAEGGFVEVYNLVGQRVWQSTFVGTSQEIDLSDCVSGSYLVVVYLGSERISRLVVKE